LKWLLKDWTPKSSSIIFVHMHMHGIRIHKGKGFASNFGQGLHLLAATHNARGKPSAFKLDHRVKTWYVKLDVTSRNQKKSRDRAFSPLLNNKMEAFWQKSKMYQGVDHARDVAWWDRVISKRNKCPRRSAIVKRYRDKRLDKQYPREIGYVCPESGEVLIDKVQARKQIYTKLYQEKVLESSEVKQRLQQFRALMQEFKHRGEALTIIVKDMDGPREDNGRESWCEYNERMHEEKLNDLRCSFGHGYCVLQALATIGQEVFGDGSLNNHE